MEGWHGAATSRRRPTRVVLADLKALAGSGLNLASDGEGYLQC